MRNNSSNELEVEDLDEADPTHNTNQEGNGIFTTVAESLPNVYFTYTPQDPNSEPPRRKKPSQSASSNMTSSPSTNRPSSARRSKLRTNPQDSADVGTNPSVPASNSDEYPKA